MVKLSVDLNEPKDSSKTDEAAQNVVIIGSHIPKSLTLEIYHGGWFIPTPSRSYIGGHVSSVNVVDIDEFCLHDIKDMIVKLGYGVEDLMYCHFLIPSLGLDYGLHSLNVDADLLKMSKYVKNYNIILVYVEHGSSIADTSMFNSDPDVNRNVRKEWEKLELVLLMELQENMLTELDTMSMDDLHNNLKVYEPEVKGMSSSSSSTQNMAFVSSLNNNTSSTNGAVNTAYEVNTANGVSTTSTQDLEQIHPDDMEEIDLRWKMAMLTMRARRFLIKTRRKLTVNGNEKIGLDKSNVECYNCHKRGHFARECRALRNQDNKHKESSRRSVPMEKNNSIVLVSCDGLGG
nr:ribonuclease H-like domain-containing protein [Tanacetum cinerariifolium]